MRLLSHNDPGDAFTLLDMEQARREDRLPKCVCCEAPILSETYLDLEPFGLSGYVCEGCVSDNTHSADNWEE